MKHVNLYELHTFRDYVSQKHSRFRFVSDDITVWFLRLKFCLPSHTILNFRMYLLLPKLTGRRNLFHMNYRLTKQFPKF